MKQSDTTWGLDLSTNKRKSAAVAVRWSPTGAEVIDIQTPLTAQDVAALISQHRDSHWAVDVPFGWPEQFVELMAVRHNGPLSADQLSKVVDWELWRTRLIARRVTDQCLYDHEDVNTRPLPASFDKLGATAAMWALIEARLAAEGVAIDRSGVTGTICETYPTAALRAWGWKAKGKPDEQVLVELIQDLEFPPDLRHHLVKDDVCDAVVCAVVARAHQLGRTVKPDASQLGAARREGWIHVCTEPLGDWLYES
jgi:Protein of unknown function (DUF429)